MSTRQTTNWLWVVEPKNDQSKAFLGRLAQYSVESNLSWEVVIDQKTRFLVRSLRFRGIEDPKTAREEAFALLDAIKGIADVLDIGKMEISLGNSIRVTDNV